VNEWLMNDGWLIDESRINDGWVMDKSGRMMDGLWMNGESIMYE
jgi:hypothetical protein